MRDFVGETPRKRKSALYLEEEKFVETFLRCLICRELLDSESRPPKLLPCHHSLCLHCILRQFSAEVEYRLSLTPDFKPSLITIVCPKCRKYFVTAEEGLHQLPTDHRVIQLIDFTRHTDVQTVQYCPKHKTQALNFFCETCTILICSDCTIVDHREVYGHRVIDFEGAVRRYTPVIDRAMDIVDSERVTLNERKVVVGKAIETMEKAEEDLVSKIHTTFAKLREALEEREKEMIEMAEQNASTEKSKLEHKVKAIDNRTKELEETYQSLKSVKESGNIEELHKTHLEVKDYKAKEPFPIPELDEGVKTNIVFNDKDDKYIEQKIKAFGEVYTQEESTQRITSPRPTSSSISSSTLGTSSYSSSKYTPSSYRSYTPSSYSYGGSGYSSRSYYKPR